MCRPLGGVSMVKLKGTPARRPGAHALISLEDETCALIDRGPARQSAEVTESARVCTSRGLASCDAPGGCGDVAFRELGERFVANASRSPLEARLKGAEVPKA